MMTRGGETKNKRTAKMLKAEKLAMKKRILYYNDYNDYHGEKQRKTRGEIMMLDYSVFAGKSADFVRTMKETNARLGFVFIIHATICDVIGIICS